MFSIAQKKYAEGFHLCTENKGNLHMVAVRDSQKLNTLNQLKEDANQNMCTTGNPMRS